MFQQLVSQHGYLGYLAVFVLMLAESACIPVPSEVVMMFAGALAAGLGLKAGTPHPALFGFFAAGVLGNIAGSYIAWAVGKYAGQTAVRRWGRLVGIREHEIDKATAWFERHGPVAVLVGRVVPVIRTFISLPAGFADMPPGIFGIYTALGAVPWTAALAIAGYALRANWDKVAKDIGYLTYAIVGILAVGIVVMIIRRRKAAASAAPAHASGAGWPGPAPSRPARGDSAGAYASADPAGRMPAAQAPPSGPYGDPRDSRAQPQAGRDRGGWDQEGWDHAGQDQGGWDQEGQDQGGWEYQPGPAGRHRSLRGRAVLKNLTFR